MITRDETIETATNYLILARVLKPPQVATYMSHITQLSDTELLKQAIGSKVLLFNYLRTCWGKN